MSPLKSVQKLHYYYKGLFKEDMILFLTFITSWFLPSLFTPSNTLPCEPVTSPGHITVHTAFRETVFAIESWRTFYWKDLFQLFSVTAVIWLIFYRYRVNTKQTTIQLYEIKYENKNIKKHKKQSFLLWYDKRFVCLLI